MKFVLFLLEFSEINNTNFKIQNYETLYQNHERGCAKRALLSLGNRGVQHSGTVVLHWHDVLGWLS